MGSSGVLLSAGARSKQLPRSGFSVDWNHPLAQRLEVLWIPALSTVAQVGALGTLTENVTQSNAGQGTRWGAGTPRRMYALVPAISRLANGSSVPATVVWVGRSTSTTDGGGGTKMFGQVTNLTDAAPFDAWAIGADNARYAFALFGSGTSSDYLVPPTANNSSTSRIGERVLMGVGTATEQSLYVNGVKDGANTASLTAPNQTNPAVAININPGQPTRLTNSSMLLGAIWSRAFSHTEAAEFAANPFCFLRY